MRTLCDYVWVFISELPSLCWKFQVRASTVIKHGGDVVSVKWNRVYSATCKKKKKKIFCWKQHSPLNASLTCEASDFDLRSIVNRAQCSTTQWSEKKQTKRKNVHSEKQKPEKKESRPQHVTQFFSKDVLDFSLLMVVSLSLPKCFQRNLWFQSW